jgi:exodeoxyribonuclease V gamma subunit
VGDRSLAVAEPVVQALLGLARLVVGRATLSGVVDLLQLQPVRQRFGIDHDDVEKITEWCLELGTRWGLDPAHRAHAGLPRTIVNGTWRATVDQLLAGVTMSAPSPRLVLGDTLPYDDLSTDEATVVGALADLLQLLLRVRDLMEDPSTSTLTQRTVHEWCDELHDIIDDLVALPSDQGWRIGQLHQAISALADGAHVNAAPCAVTFTFPQLLTILDSSLSDRAGRVSLRSGSVTVTSMVPQHGVPARVICILGLDDAVLRSGSFDGDDILGHQPCLGERQPRAEQRQVLLDALLDASDHFIITCNGADLTTNAPVPLVVPIAELLDSVELLTGASLRSTDPTHRGAPVVVHHTRHPFDEATFVPGRLTTAFSEPFGFDTSMLGAAVARRSALPAASRSDGTSLSLPVVTRSTLTLDDLIAAITSPAKVLLRERLQVRLPDDDLATIDDAIPLSVDRLTQAQLGGELLDAARHGGPSIDRATVAATHTDLPPGALAHAAIDSVATEVGAIITANQRVAGNETGTHTDLFIDLVVEPESHHTFAVHTQLFGAVSDIAHHSVEPHRSAIRVARFTKMRPSLRLGLGIQLAAATLTDPDRVWDASLVCRADSGDSNDTAATAVLRLIGETRDERCEAARTLLAMATEMAHQSFNTLVPYLDRCSNAVATKMSVSAIEKAFKRDTEYDPYAKRFWSTTDHRDFERLTITTATSVWDTYAKCVSEVLS